MEGLQLGAVQNASLYQHQKYVSLDDHVFNWHDYLMPDAFFESLTEAQQTAVTQCVEIPRVIHRSMTAAQDANAAAILSEKGMAVVPVSPGRKDMFRRASQPAVREFIVGEVDEDRPERLDAAVAAYRNQ